MRENNSFLSPLHSIHARLCHISLRQSDYEEYFQTDFFSGVIVSSDIPFFCSPNSSQGAILHSRSIRIGESYIVQL